MISCVYKQTAVTLSGYMDRMFQKVGEIKNNTIMLTFGKHKFPKLSNMHVIDLNLFIFWSELSVENRPFHRYSEFIPPGCELSIQTFAALGFSNNHEVVDFGNPRGKQIYH